MNKRSGVGGGDGFDLEQRGLIGDTESAALIAADGTIDWYCPRRFDAPAALFGLLDHEGGAVRVGPAGTRRAAGSQSYQPGTNVLRTVLPAVDGELEVVDLMPWDGRGFRVRPEGRIVRVVTALRGTVDVEVEVVPGRAFGPADRVASWSEGIAFDGIVVRTGHPVEDRRAAFTLDPGERAVVTIDLADEDRHHQPLTVDAAMERWADTADAWQRHIFGVTYGGPYRDAVERSLLAIKALTFYSTGAVVAAPTTSLPEAVGGERNWDYRYAWIRDASLAVHAARDAGLPEEADAFTSWIALVLENERLPLHPLYDVEGHLPPEEEELRLAGWRRSQPVRIGNQATEQLQLDFYGDLVRVVHQDDLRDGRPILGRWDDLATMTDWLAEAWVQPDRGIWELRTEPRQLVPSKLSCWWALRHMVDLAQSQNPLDLAAVGWHQAANEVLAWLEKRFREPDSITPDAALLRMAWRGPWPPDHPVVVRTVDHVLERLSDGFLLYRYPPENDDGLPRTESTFLPCAFWAVRALAAMGRWEEAHERMESLCALGQPLGLLAEQSDPRDHLLLGNYPQTLTHLSLVAAALALESGPS